jgi:hypothetical protein
VIGTPVAATSGNVLEPVPPPPQELREAAGVSAVEELGEFKKRYGDPPDAKLGRLRIPAIGVDAPLGQRYVGPDGEMPLPSGPSDVVWYDFSAWPGYGGSPGSGKNAIFAGHVDYAARVPYANVNYRGRGVFFSLDLLRAGDRITVQIDGQSLRYEVAWRKVVSATRGDWANIMGSNVETESITLFTCAGAFDPRTLDYADRLVVRAVRAAD